MTVPETVLFLVAQTTCYLSPMEVATEWVIVILAALVIVCIARGSHRWLHAVRQAFGSLAARKRTAMVLCGVLPVVIRLSMLGFIPVPDPSIHDEFSHLLLGDTLAHGRLTNPTHPMWMHFETIHVIQQPSYNSMYPPAQGAFLALGQVLFHEPWAGVVLSAGLMFAATCWMMQGWLPPAWAFYGTLIAIFKFGTVGLWMNSYLSGAVPGIGGALLFGSLPRLRRNARAIDAVLLGLGLVTLMNSRPFEGASLGIAACVYLLPGLLRQPRTIARVLIPTGAVLSAGLLFTGYYCYRVTGSPTRMPYQVNRDTYGWPENLAFLPAKNVVLRHRVLESMHKLELHNREAYTSPLKALESLNIRLFNNWAFFIGPVLTVPLVFLPWVLRDRRVRPLVLFFSVIVALNLFQLVLYPYHLGPVVPVVFAIVAQAIRHLYVSVSRIRRPAALYLAIVLPASLILVGIVKQNAAEWKIPLTYWETAAEPHGEARAAIEAWLSARSRKQLVLVRYSRNHSPNQEWVYNHADIDGSKIVWAREMDAASDARLLQYFSDREAWVLAADVKPQRVVRFPGLPPTSDDSATEFTDSAQIP
jgi:hypothetical protein